MELTSNQVTALNAKLPAGFKIEPIARKEPRPVGSSQRKTEADNLDFDVEFSSRLPEKRSTREKRKPSSFEEAETKPRQGESTKRIQKILQTLKKSPYAEPFLAPVDTNALPDYLQVVSEPMDLGTVEGKLRDGEYETAYQFAMDVRKIWSNSFRYNSKGSDLYSMTMEISDLFEKLFEGNEQLVLSDKKDALHDLYRKVERMSKEIKDLHARGASKALPKTLNEKPMTLQEKRVLGQNIRKLDPKHLRGVLDIVRDSMSLDADGGELVIDLDTLPPRVCRDLEQYVKNLQQSASRGSKKRKVGDVNFPGIVSAHETTTKRLKEVESQLEEIAVAKPRQDERGPKEESESESSSSDESEGDEDMPAPTSASAADNLGGFSVSSMWSNFQQERMQSAEDSYGSMLDKSHDIFNYPA